MPRPAGGGVDAEGITIPEQALFLRRHRTPPPKSLRRPLLNLDYEESRKRKEDHKPPPVKRQRRRSENSISDRMVDDRKLHHPLQNRIARGTTRPPHLARHPPKVTTPDVATLCPRHRGGCSGVFLS